MVHRKKVSIAQKSSSSHGRGEKDGVCYFDMFLFGMFKIAHTTWMCTAAFGCWQKGKNALESFFALIVCGLLEKCLLALLSIEPRC